MNKNKICPNMTYIINFIVVPSPTRIVEGQASASTREEIEVLRDHYGVNWLQVEYNFAFLHS